MVASRIDAGIARIARIARIVQYGRAYGHGRRPVHL